MPFILIKGEFKPAVEIPDGDSDRFQANNPALWKKLDGPLVRLDTSDKSKHISQEPHLKGIEAIKTTTSRMNWLLTPSIKPREHSLQLITTLVTLLVFIYTMPVWAQQKAVTDPAKCTSYDKADYGEKNYLGDLGKNWSVGTKATASFFRYNLASEKASFNDKTLGVGLSLRYYTDNQLQNTGHNDINDVPKACRARTEDLLDFSRSNSDGTLAKAGSWISFSPTLFVSKTETEGDVAIQPAIVIGLLNDIISIGTAYNLTGTGRGQWSIIVGPSYGFQW